MQQGLPILFVAKDKHGRALISCKALPRTHGNYCQVNFHHAHMMRDRYFDNFIVKQENFNAYMVEHLSHYMSRVKGDLKLISKHASMVTTQV